MTTKNQILDAQELGRPNLRFTPTAWAKLLFLRDCGDTEVGGFGIASGNDLLLVDDIQLVRQACSWAHVEFEDESVADHFDLSVEAGRRPEQFARIWIHTHPGDCPEPSSTDEETFHRVFGRSDWAVMFILARGGDWYTRLRFNTGPGGDIEINANVDYSQSFPAADFCGWEREYAESVVNMEHSTAGRPPVAPSNELFQIEDLEQDSQDGWLEYMEEELAWEGVAW